MPRSIGADNVIDYSKDDFTKRRYPLEQSAEAHRYVDTLQKTGNEIITMGRKEKSVLRRGGLDLIQQMAHENRLWGAQHIRRKHRLQRTSLSWGSLFVFFLIELGSQRVKPFGVTRHPTAEWVTHQLREATPEGIGVRYILRDNDSSSA